jgi:hypothetical protein
MKLKLYMNMSRAGAQMKNMQFKLMNSGFNGVFADV